MRVTRLEIQNFRRIGYVDIHLEPATFLIGPNNTAKSSIVAALEALLSLESERLKQDDIRETEDGTRQEETVITAHFGDVPSQVAASRGFRGRVVNREFVYRKTLTTLSSKLKLETREYPHTVKPEFEKAKTAGDLIDGGLPEDILQESLGTSDRDAKLKKGWERGVPEVLDFDTNAEPDWIENPGGIPQNVLSKLPRMIHIPAITDTKDIESTDEKHVLGECLGLLFEDLVKDNPLAEQIQSDLDSLEDQMDPDRTDSLLSKLVQEVNSIISDVFPDCGIRIKPSLQDVAKILRPKYDVSLFSNIHTDACRQGTGLVRTCAFAMLRHHARFKIQKALQTRPVLVAFEEPEQYLHPAAANLLRDTIYELGRSDQIMCTTHSPWMIDLSQDPQSLTRMYIDADSCASAYNYGVSSKLGALPSEDRQRVKMLQVFDDELSRVFFADNVVIVEGDSEVLAIKETLKLLPDETQKRVQAHFQVTKARGKASIISLIKYLKELNISPRVMHDGDFGTPGAEKFNKPISEALGESEHLVVLDKNLEEALGYLPPQSDKPFKAYEHVHTWKTHSAVPEAWRKALGTLFDTKWPP